MVGRGGSSGSLWGAARPLSVKGSVSVSDRVGS